jgi:proton-translocating NADH-quinone oxidoreductase chain M
MFIFIGIWGARERKIKAAYLFFIYTLFGSLIMLFGILYLYMVTGSTSYFVLLNTNLEAEQQRLIWICFFMAFAVKMPLYPFHIWLPEAHVEAPTVGSMLLASLLLKLGGYGFLRFSLSMLPEGSAYFNSLVSTLALLGVVYGSLSTIRQIDLKRVIAYSSVAHMNLVMLGLFSYNQQGIEGATYLMIGHGVVSAALFFCVGVIYDRYHSRLLRYYGGLVTVMPLFSFFFFSFTLANMSFPGTSNFLGEFLLFLGVFTKNSTVLLFSTVSIVLSAVYSIWLFNRISFGTLKTVYIDRFADINRRECAILTTLLIPMLILGLSANFILNFLHFPVEVLLASAPLVSELTLL